MLEKKCIDCKKTKVKKSIRCRNCSNKKRHDINLKNKLLRIIDINTEIITARESKTSHHNIEVDFTCNNCEKVSTKLYSYFKKNKICKACSTSIGAKARNEKKYGKNINKIKKFMLNNNIEYANIRIENDWIYSTIDTPCNKCNNIFTTEYYRLERFFKNNNTVLCKNCKKEEAKYKHGCSVSFYNKNDLGLKIGYFYSYSTIIEGKKVYKIGITRNNILGRVKSQAKVLSDIFYIEDTNLNNAILETKLKKKYKKYNSKLSDKFDGYTEFFDINIIKEEKLEVQRLSS